MAVASAPDWLTKAKGPGKSGQGLRWRKAGVQAYCRHQGAQAVGTEDAQQVRTGSFQHGLLNAARRIEGPGLLEASADHNGRARAALAQCLDELDHRSCRCAYDGQLRRLGQAGQVRPCLQSQHGAALGIDRPDWPLEAALQQIAKDN
jgi:hypothetical protein